MNQAESEFTVSQLKLWPGWRDKVIAALAQKDLPDTDRRSWLIVFKRLSRMQRNCLHWADWYDLIPFAQLTALWREFVETGSTVCDEQFKIIGAKLESSKLSVRQHCALCNMLVSILKMSRDFKDYKDELFALVSPQNQPEQTGGERKGNLLQTAGELTAKPSLNTHALAGRCGRG